MIRALSLAGQLYQSLAAIALIFTVGRLVGPDAYTAFSLVMASAQLSCVFAFEWVQLSGLRYLSSAQLGSRRSLRLSLYVACGLSATALCASAGFAATVAAGHDASFWLLGLAVALAQGMTDLTCMIIRVDGRLGRASLIMAVRSTLLLAGAIVGALQVGTAQAVLIGVTVAHGVSLAIALVANPAPAQYETRAVLWADLIRLARYGMLAAGASFIHLAVPVTIRYLIVGRFGVGSSIAAGASLALDLLQRPFTVLVSAIHVISYPEVVAAHDSGSTNVARRAASRLFDFIVCATVILLGSLVAFLADITRLFIRPELANSFISIGLAAIAFYFCHTQLQATLALVPHLKERAVWLLTVAICQLVSVSAVVWVTFALGQPPWMALVNATWVTVAVSGVAARPTITYGAFPRSGLATFAIAGAALCAATAINPSTHVAWLGVKLFVALAMTATITWAGDFLELRGDQVESSVDV